MDQIDFNSKLFILNPKIIKFERFIPPNGVTIDFRGIIGVYRDLNNNSYLHLAIIEKNKTKIKLLLKNLIEHNKDQNPEDIVGCVFFDVNNQLMSPIDLAILSKDINIVNIFIKIFGKCSDWFSSEKIRWRIQKKKRTPLIIALEDSTLEIFKKIYDIQFQYLGSNTPSSWFYDRDKITYQNVDNYQYIIDHMRLNIKKLSKLGYSSFFEELEIINKKIIDIKITNEKLMIYKKTHAIIK
jgi:hypothetical protein